MSDTIRLYLKEEGDLQDIIKIQLPDGSVIMRMIGDYSNKPLDLERCKDFIGCDLRIHCIEDGEEVGQKMSTFTLTDVPVDKELTKEHDKTIYKLVYEEKEEIQPPTEESSSDYKSLFPTKDEVVSVEPMSEEDVLELNKDIPSIGEEIPEKQEESEEIIEENLIKEGSSYAMMVDGGGGKLVVGTYIRVEYIQQSGIIGHRDVGVMILTPPQPVFQEWCMPIKSMDMNNPVAVQLPQFPAPAKVNEIPKGTKQMWENAKSKILAEKFQQQGGLDNGQKG